MKRLVCLAVLAALALPAAASARAQIAPGDREAIRSVLTQYIPAMLQRKDVRLGWRLSGPQIRGSATLRDWLNGSVPVYPFPARGDRVRTWTVNYVTAGDIGLDLLIQPRKGADQPAIAFRIEMTKIGGAWKVNAFYPEATFDTKHAKVFSPQDATANGSAREVPKPKVSGSWLALPAAVAGALLLLGIPAGVFWTKRRDRRIHREYLARTNQI